MDKTAGASDHIIFLVSRCAMRGNIVIRNYSIVINNCFRQKHRLVKINPSYHSFALHGGSNNYNVGCLGEYAFLGEGVGGYGHSLVGG